MKNISKSLLAIAVAGVAFVASCKKGEDDPSISLRSRKGRVAGEWKVASQEMTHTQTNTSGTFTSSSTTTEKFTGDKYSRTGSFTSGSTTTSSTVDGTVAMNTWTFEKDGTWKQSLDYTTTEVETDDFGGGYSMTVTTETHYVYNNAGVWNFLGKVQDDTKNKEEMSVSTTSENRTVTTKTTTVSTSPGGSVTDTDTDSDTDTDTFGNNEQVMVWKITQLKNDEMKVTASGKGTSTSSSSSTSGSTTTTSTSSGSHDSVGTITLTQE